MEIFYFYLAIVSVIAFWISFIDKHAAIRHRRRISERTLFLWAIIGGSVGLYLSMLIFRHKTRHLSFMLGIPAIMVLQVLTAWFLLFRR